MATMEVLTRVEAQAAEIKPGRTVLAAVAWVLYGLGYAAALLMTRVIWGSSKFALAAVRVGWVSAVGPSKRSQIEALKRQVADQAMQLSRFSG